MSSIPFLTFSPSAGFQLSPETEAFLSSTPQTPLAVLSIVGNYRTGKSFFINRVLLNRTHGEGFPVGPSINPCTKGLWLWNEPLEHENPEVPNDVKVLLVDTEGFGGIDQNTSHNSRIGLFALLLSSVFVYNSLGVIDENAIASLSLIVSLGQEVLRQGQNQDMFPGLVWVLRDFALKMVDEQGKGISNREYLERALEINAKMNENKAKTRKNIREIFRERDCITLVRPVADEKELQRLDKMDQGMMRPEFKEQARRARKAIFSGIRPKKINGKVMTAGMLLEMCRSFISVINSDGVPNVKETWTYLSKSQINSTFSGCVAFVEIEYDKLKTLDLGPNELKTQCQRVKREVKERVRGSLLGLCEKPELKATIGRIKEFIKGQNKELQRLVNERTQKKSMSFLEEKLRAFKHLDFKSQDSLLESKNIHDFLQKNGLISPDISSFQQRLFELSFEAFHFELSSQRSSLSRLSDHRLAVLQQELSAKKAQFSEEKQALELKIEEIQRKASEKRNMQSQTDENMASNTEKIELFKRKVAETVAEKQNAEERMKVLLMELEKLRKENERLIALRKDYEAMKTDNNRLRMENERVIALKKECEAMKTDNNIRKENERVIALKKECEAMKTDNNRLRKENDERVIALKRENEAMKTDNDRLRLENERIIGASAKPSNQRLSLPIEPINKPNTHKESEDELIQLTNRALTLTLEKTEEQTQVFKAKIAKLKPYKRLFAQTLQFQCKGCQRFLPQAAYFEHSQQNSCQKDREIVNIYSSLSEIEAKSLTNLESIESDSQLICENILNPLQDNYAILNAKNAPSFQKKSPQNLEELIQRLNSNEKYSVLHARKLELQSPKTCDLGETGYKSTLKKEQKNTSIFTGMKQRKGDKVLTLNSNLWENGEINSSENNPCSQRYDSMNLLFKSMRNVDFVAKKQQEMKQRGWGARGSNNKSGN